MSYSFIRIFENTNNDNNNEIAAEAIGRKPLDQGPRAVKLFCRIRDSHSGNCEEFYLLGHNSV
jgi:hypothetical protein